jgi:hypothetical protein
MWPRLSEGRDLMLIAGQEAPKSPWYHSEVHRESRDRVDSTLDLVGFLLLSHHL